MGGRELSCYRHISLNLLRHAHRALEMAESRNPTGCHAIVFGSEDGTVDRPMQQIQSNAKRFKNKAAAKFNSITGSTEGFPI